MASATWQGDGASTTIGTAVPEPLLSPFSASASSDFAFNPPPCLVRATLINTLWCRHSSARRVKLSTRRELTATFIRCSQNYTSAAADLLSVRRLPAPSASGVRGGSLRCGRTSKRRSTPTARSSFFNNAGIEGKWAHTAEYDEDMFDAVIGVNVKGVFLGLRHVLPVMLRQKRGAIVNTASVAGLVATPGMPADVEQVALGQTD
jgi:NAD(P)-dependent dehydrogenase (short-subunit alcohol dehydrogenase family)